LTTLISHARRTALSITTLTALVSLTSLGASLITPVGVSSLLAPDMIATSGATVTLAAIATDTDREKGAAFGRATNPQTNEDFVLDRPAHSGIMLGRMTCAFGADDVARSGSRSKNYVFE
jgi:hypothetical protein